MLRRQRVSEGICFCGRKAADLKIFLFSATKQDRVGRRLHMSFQREKYIQCLQCPQKSPYGAFLSTHDWHEHEIQY